MVMRRRRPEIPDPFLLLFMAALPIANSTLINHIIYVQSMMPFQYGMTWYTEGMKALWNGAVLAESDNTITIEGNQYFPPESINRNYFEESTETSVCPWKGDAQYYTVVVGDSKNDAAAWYYPEPKESALKKVGTDFSNYLAFWKGVQVVP